MYTPVPLLKRYCSASDVIRVDPVISRAARSLENTASGSFSDCSTLNALDNGSPITNAQCVVRKRRFTCARADDGNDGADSKSNGVAIATLSNSSLLSLFKAHSEASGCPPTIDCQMDADYGIAMLVKKFFETLKPKLTGLLIDSIRLFKCTVAFAACSIACTSCSLPSAT